MLSLFLQSSTPRVTLWQEDYYYPHFADEETEPQRGWFTCPKVSVCLSWDSNPSVLCWAACWYGSALSLLRRENSLCRRVLKTHSQGCNRKERRETKEDHLLTKRFGTLHSLTGPVYLLSPTSGWLKKKFYSTIAWLCTQTLPYLTHSLRWTVHFAPVIFLILNFRRKAQNGFFFSHGVLPSIRNTRGVWDWLQSAEFL